MRRWWSRTSTPRAAGGRRTADGGRRTAELIGPSARFVQVDMRDDDAVGELMACQPQILVNNAGRGAVLRPCFPEASVERWTDSLLVNLRAPMLTTQLALPGMRAAGGPSPDGCSGWIATPLRNY